MGYLSTIVGWSALLLAIVEGLAFLRALLDSVTRLALEDHLREATNSSYVLPPKFADTRLSVLGKRGILSWMNAVLKTDRALSSEMQRLLQFCLDSFADFGQAYVLLRPRWHMAPLEALRNIETRQKEDWVYRRSALENVSDVTLECHPRRLWDLRSNRVVPFWVVQIDPDDRTQAELDCMAVYHTWLGKSHARNVFSSVNAFEWPIPVPFDITFEDIHAELLELASKHSVFLVWLDVLCLRQSQSQNPGGVPRREFSKGSKWKFDDITIWPIYSRAKWTIYYVNEPGRPPYISRSDCDADVESESSLQATREKISPPILSAEHADTHLVELGIPGILSWMNDALGTDYVLSASMCKLLLFCLCTFTDFGQAHALLRPRWHMSPSEALDNIKARRSEDQAFWSKSLEDRIVSDTECLPRRLWDLWSNRAVPLWVVQVDRIDESEKWLAVYHSQVNKDHQHNVTSPINGHEWLVPVPVDTTLERIRVHLLPIATQREVNFVWLDVVCQQQECGGASSEEPFTETDTPTLWSVYSHAERIIFYLEGLGGSFEVSNSVNFCDQQSESHARDRSYDDVLKKKKKKWAQRTIYSCVNKTERRMLEVEHQKSFTGPSYILSSELADTPLSDLGMQGILSRMNGILGTHYALSLEMRLLLLFCMCTFRDYGQAFSLLRPRWHTDPSEALENIEIRQKEDQKLRSEALENDIVVKPRIPPRRVWDIWSNRVMPFWVVEERKICESKRPRRRDWLAISHSWMHSEHRHNVNSPINGHEWPIPIPKDTSLERIRVELLNLAAERGFHIVWLDVLCLRQEGVQSKEGLRKAEWKLDVPTIGPIYAHAGRTVYYFSGLGRPFTAPTDKHDTRHWMNRAWTLQETQPRLIIAGRSFTSSPDIPYIADLVCGNLYGHLSMWQNSIDNSGDVMKALMTPFLENDELSVWTALKLMQNRTGTSELDKIAGLVYRLNGFEPPLPAYIVGEDIEDAWDRLIEATRSDFRVELFFGFPEPGKGKHVWYPSWQQIVDSSTIPDSELMVFGQIEFDENSEEYIFTGGYCVEDCLVEGLSDVYIGRRDGSSTRGREGKVHVVDKEGVKHDISVTADVETTIADGQYTLVGSNDVFDPPEEWVVARKTMHGFTEKISLIQVKGWDNREAMVKVGKSFGKSSLRLA